MRRLSLAYNGLGNEGATALADALKSNTTLVDLDISCNRIHQQGAEALVKGIESNETLKILKVCFISLVIAGNFRGSILGTVDRSVPCVIFYKLKVAKDGTHLFYH